MGERGRAKHNMPGMGVGLNCDDPTTGLLSLGRNRGKTSALLITGRSGLVLLKVEPRVRYRYFPTR